MRRHTLACCSVDRVAVRIRLLELQPGEVVHLDRRRVLGAGPHRVGHGSGVFRSLVIANFLWVMPPGQVVNHSCPARREGCKENWGFVATGPTGATSCLRPWRACRRRRGRGWRRGWPAARSRPPSRRSRGLRPRQLLPSPRRSAATLASTWRVRLSMFALTSLILAAASAFTCAHFARALSAACETSCRAFWPTGPGWTGPDRSAP